LPVLAALSLSGLVFSALLLFVFSSPLLALSLISSPSLSSWSPNRLVYLAPSHTKKTLDLKWVMVLFDLCYAVGLLFFYIKKLYMQGFLRNIFIYKNL
jgi:hypothetical protein